MAGHHTRTPGARASASGGHGSKPIEQRLHHSATRSDLQESAAVDELLFKLGDRLRRPGLTDFEAGFCKSLLGQAKRGGPRWRPSDRQRAVADGILAERDDEPEESLIEEEGLPDDWPF